MVLINSSNVAEHTLPPAGTSLAFGKCLDGDVDAAFDDAVGGAIHDYGERGATATIASVDADAVTAHQHRAVPLPRAYLLAQRALAGDELEEGRAYGWAVCPDSAFARRRIRLQITGDDALRATLTRATGVDDDLERVLRASAEQAGVHIDDDEQVESVSLVRSRARFKPVSEVFRAKSAAEFAVLDARGTILERGLPTAGAARRAAVALVKAGPVNGQDTGYLDVIKLVGREGGNPLARVTRSLVAATTSVQVSLVREKNPQRTKTTGWLFAARLGEPQTD